VKMLKLDGTRDPIDTIGPNPILKQRYPSKIFLHKYIEEEKLGETDQDTQFPETHINEVSEDSRQSQVQIDAVDELNKYSDDILAPEDLIRAELCQAYQVSVN